MTDTNSNFDPGQRPQDPATVRRRSILSAVTLAAGSLFAAGAGANTVGDAAERDLARREAEEARQAAVAEAVRINTEKLQWAGSAAGRRAAIMAGLLNGTVGSETTILAEVLAGRVRVDNSKAPASAIQELGDWRDAVLGRPFRLTAGHDPVTDADPDIWVGDVSLTGANDQIAIVPVRLGACHQIEYEPGFGPDNAWRTVRVRLVEQDREQYAGPTVIMIDHETGEELPFIG